MRRLSKAKVSGGFTLIELLVVIAIIAILAGILFPVFARAKKSAITSNCGSNLSQLAKAFLQYAQDHNGMVCRVYSLRADGSVNPAAADNSALRSTSGPYRDLQPYVKSDQMWLCPGGGLSCDYYTDGTRYQIDYRFNPYMNYSEVDSQYGRRGFRLKKLDHCAQPSSFYIISDRHTNHHSSSSRIATSPEYFMLMVMSDGHLTKGVKPYSPDWKDSRGNLKYTHWDFPYCHQQDQWVTAEY